MPSYLVDQAVTTSTESQSKQENRGGINIPTQLHAFCSSPGGGGGGGILPKKLDRGVRPASQNPYPIYD